MKTLPLITLGILVLSIGCGKEFQPLLEKARKDHLEGNHIGAIDAIKDGLPLWDESDGKELKGEAYQILGLSYHRIRKFDKAIEAYTQANNLSNNTYQSAYNLGLLYITSSQPKLAAKAYSKALRMKKDDPMALLGLGNVYFDLGEYQTAILNYKRIVETAPAVKDAMENISLAKHKLKLKYLRNRNGKGKGR